MRLTCCENPALFVKEGKMKSTKGLLTGSLNSLDDPSSLVCPAAILKMKKHMFGKAEQGTSLGSTKKVTNGRSLVCALLDMTTTDAPMELDRVPLPLLLLPRALIEGANRSMAVGPRHTTRYKTRCGRWAWVRKFTVT
jgi:hypothetical protein